MKIFLFTFLLGIIIFILLIPKPEPIYLCPTPTKYEKPKPIHEIFGIIKEINNKNKTIKSIYIQNMPIAFCQNKLKINVTGELAMKKDLFFRLIVRKFTKEMDFGSNDQLFWFWSKRINILYYANHKDLEKTNLKTVLNPNWMAESLNINELNTNNIQISKFNNYWSIIEPRQSITTGDEVIFMILIDPIKKIVIGKYLYDGDKILASTEYFQNKIKIIWFEENISMIWDMSDIKINVNINPEFFKMPSGNKHSLTE